MWQKVLLSNIVFSSDLAELTDASNPEEEASVAEVVLGGLELPRPPERGQLLADRAPVRKSIARKVLVWQRKKCSI